MSAHDKKEEPSPSRVLAHYKGDPVLDVLGCDKTRLIKRRVVKMAKLDF